MAAVMAVDRGWELQAIKGIDAATPAPPNLLRLSRRPRTDAVDTSPLTIDVAAHTHCVLVEMHDAEPQPAQDEAAQVLQIDLNLAPGATLQHLRVIAPAHEARVDHRIRVRIDEQAHYHQLLIASGGLRHLQGTEIELASAGAAAQMAAVLFAADAALEQQVSIVHAAADTHSSVETLVLASGRARAAVAAQTRIAPGAADAQARQRLAGIPTGGQPQLALRPHLQINHDQVQAAHGATWGALPQDALFYAQQRGLDEPAARRLIIEGMALAVLERAMQPQQRDAGDGSDRDESELLQTLGVAARLHGAVARHLSASPDARSMEHDDD
ncbi:MAG: hypothetical protein ABT05_06410 [Lautropia sp. SCN 66-9]|nr:MAG: hypothetical protein ABT05_06410 [Lautropia sp. SCN 66-9]